MFDWFKHVVVVAFVAFFKDEAAFERWMRGLGNWLAGTVMVSAATIIPFTDDPVVAYHMIVSWTAKEWITRVGGAFVFFIVNARVHKGPSIDEIHKALADRGVIPPPNNGPTPPSTP